MNGFKRTAVSTVYRPANDERVPTLTEFAIERPVIIVPGIMGSDLWTKSSSGHPDLQVWPPFAAPRGFPELAPLELLDSVVPKIAISGMTFHAIYGASSGCTAEVWVQGGDDI